MRVPLCLSMSILRHRQTIPLAAGMQAIQDQVENPHQWRFAHIASLGRRQIRQDILLELFLSYTIRDSAHACPTLAGSFARS